MTPQMIAALASGRARLTALFEFTLPSGTRRLMFGSSEVTWGSKFVGHDDTFGQVDTTDDVSEDLTGTAPNTSLTIIPAPTAVLADIAGPQVQLSRVRIWLAALTQDVNDHQIVVPDPDLQFDGFVDQVTVQLDRGRKELDYTLISPFDYFFEDGEGERLNSQFHRSVWAGEAGLDNVTGITRKIYWGMNAPPGARGGSSSIYGPGSGSISGGWLGRGQFMNAN